MLDPKARVCALPLLCSIMILTNTLEASAIFIGAREEPCIFVCGVGDELFVFQLFTRRVVNNGIVRVFVGLVDDVRMGIPGGW